MKVTKKMKLDALMPYYKVTDIYSTNGIIRKHKGHYFDKGTMRFFKSKVMLDVFPTDSGRVYFVTSEMGPDNVRKFSVRSWSIVKDDISTVGEFQGYATKTQALSAALDAAYNAVQVGK